MENCTREKVGRTIEEQEVNNIGVGLAREIRREKRDGMGRSRIKNGSKR